MLTNSDIILAICNYIKSHPGCIKEQYSNAPYTDHLGTTFLGEHDLDVLEHWISDPLEWEIYPQDQGDRTKDGSRWMRMFGIIDLERASEDHGMFDGVVATVYTDLADCNILEISLEQD